MSKRAAVGVPKQEGKIHRLLITALARQPLEKGLRRVICSELDISHGIADVVVATANGKTNDREWLAPRHLRHVNFTTARLIAQLRYNSYKPISDIGKSTGFAIRTVSEHLRILERLGLVRNEGDKARLMRSAKSPFLDVTAFEVKVSDWRHGLYQATHYRSFANRVALVLPDSKAQSVAVNRRVFAVFGIGLVGIDVDGSLRWYIKPLKRRPRSVSHTVLGVVEILKRKEARVLREHGK